MHKLQALLQQRAQHIGVLAALWSKPLQEGLLNPCLLAVWAYFWQESTYQANDQDFSEGTDQKNLQCPYHSTVKPMEQIINMLANVKKRTIIKQRK